MNEEIRIGEKKKASHWLPASIAVALVFGGGTVLWRLAGERLDLISSRMAQVDQIAQRLDAIERAMNALPGALPSVDAVAPLLAPPIVIPPAKSLPAPPALKNRLLSLLPATAVAASWQQQMLNEHNKWRAVVGVQPLKWSAGLEQSAQQVANHLAASGCEMEHSGSENGENLHKSGAVRWSSGRTEHRQKTPAQIVGAWGGEADNYRWMDNTCTGECGHYTQMVWKDTTAVGCARARCGNNEDIAVCQYNPAGNIRGKRPF